MVVGSYSSWQCRWSVGGFAGLWADFVGQASSPCLVASSHSSFFCPTVFALMDPLLSSAACWPATSSSSDIGFYGPFAVVDLDPGGRPSLFSYSDTGLSDRFDMACLGPEGGPPAPRLMRSLICRSTACGFPPAVVPELFPATSHSRIVLSPGLVNGGVGVGVLGAGGGCRGHYDPYAVLEEIEPSEDLRSVSNNRLFVIDRSPHLMLESAGSNAGYLGESSSCSDSASYFFPPLPGGGTSTRPNSHFSVAPWYAPPRVLVRDMAVQA